MDPTILQLFAADEILERLARKKLTGCFKVFTPLESANVFFKKGIVVAAIKGDVQGEEALKQIMEWKEALFVWQPDLTAPIPPLKPFSIRMDDFLGKKTNPSTVATGKVAVSDSTENIPVIQSGGGPASRTATKSITATAATRSANDDELLRKHRLALVSANNRSHVFKIAQVTSLIGRNPGCDITIPDPSISRQHCILQIMDRGLHVKDLNTVNGTKINGITMKEGYINAGDKLTVGHLDFVLEQVKG